MLKYSLRRTVKQHQGVYIVKIQEAGKVDLRDMIISYSNAHRAATSSAHPISDVGFYSPYLRTHARSAAHA
jgi:hypothetical protein